METQCLIRSVSRLSLLASTGASRALVPRVITANSSLPSTRRHKATAGRMRRALNIAPHKSFTAKDPSATPGVDQIIFNPPASVASVFHTPFKFLPKGDPRRRANLAAMFESARPVTTIGSSSTTTTSSSSSSPTPISSGGGGAIASLVSSIKPRAPQGSTTVDSAHLPPRVNHEYYTAQKHHLSPADVAEMRRLRAEDPETWSVLKLARHYNASPIFVIIAIKSSPEHREKLKAHHAKMKEKLNATKARWGPIRTKARQDRKRRRQMLMRGEL